MLHQRIPSIQPLGVSQSIEPGIEDLKCKVERTRTHNMGQKKYQINCRSVRRLRGLYLTDDQSLFSLDSDLIETNQISRTDVEHLQGSHQETTFSEKLVLVYRTVGKILCRDMYNIPETVTECVTVPHLYMDEIYDRARANKSSTRNENVSTRVARRQIIRSIIRIDRFREKKLFFVRR